MFLEAASELFLGESGQERSAFGIVLGGCFIVKVTRTALFSSSFEEVAVEGPEDKDGKSPKNEVGKIEDLLLVLDRGLEPLNMVVITSLHSLIRLLHFRQKLIPRKTAILILNLFLLHRCQLMKRALGSTLRSKALAVQELVSSLSYV